MVKYKMLFSRLKDKLFQTIKRYPMSIICLVASSIMFIIAIEIDSSNSNIDQDIFIRLALSLLYGGIISLVIKSVIERFEFSRKISLLSFIIVPISIITLYLTLLNNFSDPMIMLRYSLLCLLTGSLFFYIPFIKKDKDAPYFAQKVVLRFAITILYFGIITGGVDAIIYALEHLLTINIPENIYIQVPIFIAGFIMPAFFYVGIPKKDDKEAPYPKLLKILLLYIVFTLLTAYTLVLYIYFIKILIEFSLPNNLLGNLVIHYSLISVAALYFALPLKGENKWSTIIYKVYPYTLVPSVIMMIISFMVRINAYGITEARYYALVCALFVILSIVIIMAKKLHVRFIPLVFTILLLVSTFGPISSFNISKLSQNKRLESILSLNGMLDTDKIMPKSDLDGEVMTEISEIVNYFDDNHSLSDIKLVPNDFKLDDMESVFGFYLHYGYETSDNLAIRTNFDMSNLIDIDGYSYIINLFARENHKEFVTISGTISIEVDNESTNSLAISLDQKLIYQTDMMELFSPYFKNETSPHIEREDSNHRELPEVIILDENENISIKIIVDYAFYNETEDILDYNIYLLFRLK